MKSYSNAKSHCDRAFDKIKTFFVISRKFEDEPQKVE